VVVVGEAPGYQEAKAGKPFTGPSGKLLKIVLADNDIDFEGTFVTNACLCRPPNNATPPAEAVRACSVRLQTEVMSRRPEVLIALGNTAAQSILGSKDGVTKLRIGTGRTSEDYPGVRIIPTIHPAACLRQGDMFPSMVADIGKVRRGPVVNWEPPTFKVFDDQATEALTELRNLRSDSIAVDIEVGVDKDEFDHPDRYDMLCVGIGYAPGRAIVLSENACASNRVRTELRRLLDEKSLICHNGKFDIPGLRAFCSTGAKLAYDTMLASYTLDERQGTHSLDYCGVEFLGTPDWKNEIKRYVKKGDSYGIVPREVLYRYNAFDASVTYELKDYFDKEMQREGTTALHDFLVEASEELIYPEIEGVFVDLPYNEYLTEHYVDDLEELDKLLQDLTGTPKFNPRSPKQVKEYLLAEGIPFVETTNAEFLESIKGGPFREFALLMLEQRKGQKLYGTYVKGIRKRLYKGRVHPTFLLHGTVSGRLSCRNPNLQNIPRGSVIRRQFVPAPGNVFLQGDYSQAELRVMATLSGDRYLRELFNDPTRDIFEEVGQRLYGDRAIGHKELRIRTKAYAYGLSYGREEYSIAQEFKIPVREAKRGMDAFMGLIPELNAWRQDLMHKVLHEEGDLITAFGRHRRFWLITDDNRKDTLKEALSFYPQSTASDICLTALGRIRRGLGSRGSVRVPVHDSILVECATEEADEVSQFMKETMEQTARDVFTDFVPFPVEIERGPSWGELA